MTTYESTSDKADFNMAVSYLNGLNQMFLAAAAAQVQMDIKTWYHMLLAIYSGLACWMDRNETQEMEFRLRELHDKVSYSANKAMKYGITEIDEETYWNMLKINSQFLKIAKDRNLLMRLKEDRSSGFTN